MSPIDAGDATSHFLSHSGLICFDLDLKRRLALTVVGKMELNRVTPGSDHNSHVILMTGYLVGDAYLRRVSSAVLG